MEQPLETAKPQSGNDYQLYDFQADGVAWLNSLRDNGYGFKCPPKVGLLGDEMGLGKTAQALRAIFDMIFPAYRCTICKTESHNSHCAVCKNNQTAKPSKRILFVVPGATIIQWQKQFDRWILDCDSDPFRLSLQAITNSKQRLPLDGCIVMSHSMMASKPVIEKLIKLNLDGIVIDEIHKFGSTGTKRIKQLWALINLTESHFGECRIGLSGTPVRNYAKEIYNIAHFLDPLKFRNLSEFSSKYLTFDHKALWNPQQFHADFEPYYIRRTVSQVQKDLPSVRRTKLYTEITDPFLAGLYNKQLDLMSNFMNHGEKIGQFSLLGYLIKLRHITGIAKAKEPAIIEPIREYLVGTNGIDSQQKVIIGIHHHLVTHMLRERSLKEFPHYLIRGGQSPQEKENIKLAFMKAEGAAIAQLSIKAAAEGIDGLQHAACKAYIFERQWNGADELQFEKRIHRTGQTRPCHIEITLALGTVDEFFDEMIDEKRRYTTQVEDVNYETNPAFLKQLAEKVIANRLPTNQVRSYEDNSILEDMVENQSLNYAMRSGEAEQAELNKLLQEVEYDILSNQPLAEENEGER